MTIAVGIIGAGFIGSRHAKNLLGFHDTRVAAVADVALDRATALAARCGAKAYDDYRELLAKEALDALYICVPPFAHGVPEAMAIERRLPFFVEKPLALDVATAETIAEGVSRHGIITATGYHWRYLDILERAQQLLSQTQPRLAIGYWLDCTPPPSWWVRELQSGGQIVEQTTHLVDLARVLIGEVERVWAIGCGTQRAAFPDADIFDVSTMTLQFVTGALGCVSSTCLLERTYRIGLQVIAEGLTIEVSQITPEEFELIVDTRQGRQVQQARGDPVLWEDRDFIDAVAGKANGIRAPYHEALNTHRVAAAAAQAARQGCAVELRGEGHGD